MIQFWKDFWATLSAIFGSVNKAAKAVDNYAAMAEDMSQVHRKKFQLTNDKELEDLEKQLGTTTKIKAA